jgi:hypothetical protein
MKVHFGRSTLDVRQLAVFALLVLLCVALVVAVTNAGWCAPALHGALTLATALGTWWLARDDLTSNSAGAVTRLVVTGLALGLGLTWLGASVVALTGEPHALHHFIADTALHWTPLGLVAAFIGTGFAIILDEIGHGPETGGDGQA